MLYVRVFYVLEAERMIERMINREFADDQVFQILATRVITGSISLQFYEISLIINEGIILG
jgi:hypothetical protein